MNWKKFSEFSEISVINGGHPMLPFPCWMVANRHPQPNFLKYNPKRKDTT